MLARFNFKLGLFILLIAVIQAGIHFSSRRSRKNVPEAYVKQMKLLQSADDIVYLGDSVQENVGDDDPDPRSVDRFLQDLLPGRTVTRLSHSAYHLQIYESIVRRAIRDRRPPRLFIIPVNMRSFSNEWHSRPTYQFSRERLFFERDSMLLRAFLKPLGVFKYYDPTPIGQSEWEAMPVFDGSTPVGAVRDFIGEETFAKVTEENMRKKVIFHYMASLAPHHPKVRAMVRLERLLRRNNIKYVIYVSPVDIEFGDQVLGPRFAAQIAENVAVLQQVGENHGFTVHDFSSGVPTEGFNWRYDLYPNEHLKEQGRRYLAHQLARLIK